MSTSNNVDIYNAEILSGKIHESLEDPVSSVFYDMAQATSPYLYEIGVTPNMITTIRLMLVIVGFGYFFENGYYRTSSLMFLANYFGDCLDGHMARKYGMETVFGDYYDHITDILTYIIAFYYTSVNIDPEYDWLVLLIFVILILSLAQVGCEERYLKLMNVDKNSLVMSRTSGLCPKSLVPDSDLESVMEFSRLFGTGVFVAFVALIIWNFESFEIR